MTACNTLGRGRIKIRYGLSASTESGHKRSYQIALENSEEDEYQITCQWRVSIEVATYTQGCLIGRLFFKNELAHDGSDLDRKWTRIGYLGFWPFDITWQFETRPPQTLTLPAIADSERAAMQARIQTALKIKAGDL